MINSFLGKTKSLGTVPLLLKEIDISLLLKRKLSFKESFLIKDLEELKSFSLLLSKIVFKNCFLALCGDVGSGKTTLVRFLCSSVGVKEVVNSPTFSILKSYWVKKENCFLNHFDFFRLSDKDDYSLFESFKEENINVAEWANNFPFFWVNERLLFYIKISFISSSEREVSVTIFI